MSTKISIVIPVFNAIDYLSECIESVLSQTFTDSELILVDDGSVDDSLSICKKYARKDKRITVIHQENNGVSEARNSGLKIAKGDYIGFVDSDDHIYPKMYETLYNNAIESNADVVVSGIKEESNSSCSVEKRAYTEKRYFNRSEFLNEFAYLRQTKNATILHSPVNKLYKKSIVSDKKFNKNVKICEDYFFNLNVFNDVQSVLFIPDVDYVYRFCEKSATNRINWTKELLISHVDTIDRTFLFCKENNITNANKSINRYASDLYLSILLDLVGEKKFILCNLLASKMTLKLIFSEFRSERKTIFLFTAKLRLHRLLSFLKSIWWIS